MPSNALPPLFGNTADDHGAPPVVMGYIGASITVLLCAIRLFLTIRKKSGFSADDYTFYTGALLAFVSSITLERAVDVGLGRHDNALSTEQLNTYTKLTYTTSLLGILSQSCAKLSVAFLYERLAPRQDKRGIAILLSCVGAWIVFAFIGTAFACNAKLSYTANCTTDGYLSFPIIVTDLVTDAMLAFWMVPRVYKLQASRQHRIIPILLMSMRILVCCLEAGQIGYLAKLRSRTSYNMSDKTWNASTIWSLSICTIHLSVITATIPRINTFIADIQTNQSGLAITRRDYEHYKSSKSGSNNGSRNKSPSGKAVLDSFRPDPVIQRRNDFGQGSRSGEEIEMDVRDPVETGSQSSLQRNAVYQKTEFRWEEEYTGTSPPEREVHGQKRR
ncbi:hypothetical protein LTR85_005073 [Meristemomyces frigidus]|nr:hypothetical protein LTR85_005073 [Meristemomyces frigidus]